MPYIRQHTLACACIRINILLKIIIYIYIYIYALRFYDLATGLLEIVWGVHNINSGTSVSIRKKHPPETLQNLSSPPRKERFALDISSTHALTFAFAVSLLSQSKASEIAFRVPRYEPISLLVSLMIHISFVKLRWILCSHPAAFLAKVFRLLRR